MKDLIKILNEELSKNLHHITGFKAVINILKNNEFKLSPAEARLKDGKYDNFYMSFARSTESSYIKSIIDFPNPSSCIILELNGEKLNERYKGKPVSFFGVLNKKNKEKKYDQKRDEYEDRLISSKEKIPNAKKYIKAIHILFSPRDRIYKEAKASIYRIQKLAGNIPIYIYDNPKDLKAKRTDKAKRKIQEIK